MQHSVQLLRQMFPHAMLFLCAIMIRDLRSQENVRLCDFLEATTSNEPVDFDSAVAQFDQDRKKGFFESLFDDTADHHQQSYGGRFWNRKARDTRTISATGSPTPGGPAAVYGEGPVEGRHRSCAEGGGSSSRSAGCSSGTEDADARTLEGGGTDDRGVEMAPLAEAGPQTTDTSRVGVDGAGLGNERGVEGAHGRRKD